LVLSLISLMCVSGCIKRQTKTPVDESPVVRVRLVAGADSVKLTSGGAWRVTLVTRAGVTPVDASNFAGRTFDVELGSSNVWQVGGAALGSIQNAELWIVPESVGTLAISGKRYRGAVRLVPVAGGKFDVVNELTIDDYLKGVVPREMPAGWGIEALKTQACVARTYALFEARQRVGTRHWDLFADVRSQVYGGMDAEKPSTNRAVDETAGLVVAAPNTAGQLRIFKAYFSSCCGGVTQTAADAFDDADVKVFESQDVGELCRESSRFRWADRVYAKSELTQRMRAWGKNQGNPIGTMGTLERMDVLRNNPQGRPAEFVVSDAAGVRFRLTSEQARWAMNTNRPAGEEAIYSGFFTPVSDGNSIRLTQGRGWGHGVGMCQWCAKARADKGLGFEQIVRQSYPSAELVRAY